MLSGVAAVLDGGTQCGTNTPTTKNARQLALLDFKWEDGVHDGRPAVHVDDLTCNEAGLLHAQERHGVADVFRGPEPSHRRPPALVPGSRGVLDVLRQRAQDTTLDYIGRAEDAAGADAVDGDTARGQGHGEVAHQRVERCLRGPHRHPRLPTPGAAAWRVGYGDDPALIIHQARRLPRPD